MFKNKVINSFKKIRRDMEALKEAISRVSEDTGAVKQNSQEWIMHLNSSQKDLEIRMIEMERRIMALEQREQERNQYAY